jgi:hypothetical protein
MIKSPIDLSEATSIIKNVIEQESYSPRAPYHLLARSYFENDPTGKSMPEEVMPKDKALEFAKRLRRADELFGTKCKFKHFDISNAEKERILTLLPSSLKNQNITMTLQTCKDGDYLIPHTDHLRKASFFIILSEPDMITRFYKKIVDFTEYDMLKYANPDHLEAVFEINLEKDAWYLFNQQEFHSSHRTKSVVNRTSFCIEFVDLTFDQVLNLL